MNDFNNLDKKGVVLIVDDSRVSRMHLVQILQDDYIVHTAESGIEAINVAKVAIPDIVLMDIVMPQIDGYQALTALKDMRETKDIPVMFITSLNQEINEEKGLRLGAVDYIAKPYNPSIIKLRVGLQFKLIQQMRAIKHLSTIDTVTGLPNRRYFENHINEEWQRAVSEKLQLGILLIDIDNLKAFNATHGYKKGDEGILSVAKSINGVVSKLGEMAARWADDSFAVLLMNSPSELCQAVGEKIRKEAEQLPFADKVGMHFTLSLGGNSIMPAGMDTTVEQFISNADFALYSAKEAGRNKVVMYS